MPWRCRRQRAVSLRGTLASPARLEIAEAPVKAAAPRHAEHVSLPGPRLRVLARGDPAPKECPSRYDETATWLVASLDLRLKTACSYPHPIIPEHGLRTF